MDSVQIIPATVEHAKALAPLLRMEDRAEVFRLYGWDAETALVESLRASTSAWTAIAEGEPIAMFGVCPVQLLGAIGLPWLLTGDGIERHKLTFVREARKFIEQTRTIWPVLVGIVDPRYEKALRFCKRLGFKVQDPAPLPNLEGALGCRIEMGA